MTLQELRSMTKKMECGEIEFRGRCHDCKAEISVTAGIEMGKLYKGVDDEYKNPA